VITHLKICEPAFAHLNVRVCTDDELSISYPILRATEHREANESPYLQSLPPVFDGNIAFVFATVAWIGTLPPDH
jgi:hypothetical protein